MKTFLVALLIAIGTPCVAAAELPVVVPVILPVTGGNAFAGSGQRTALTLLQELVNRGGGVRGRSIVFDIHDSGSNSQVAVQLLHQYVGADVPVFIGDSFIATCAAIAAQVQDGGPVDFCLSPGLTTKPNGFAFAPGHPSMQIAAGVLGYLRARHVKRVALFVATGATGVSMDGYFVDVFAKPQNRDLTLVTREHFNPSDLSVDAQITRIRAAGAKAIIAYTSGATFGTVLHGLNDVGPNLPVITSKGNLSFAFLEQYKALLPQELLLVSGPLPSEGEPVPDGPFKSAQVVYLAAFRNTKVKRDFSEAVAWDAGTIIVAALRKLGPQGTAEQVRRYALALHDFPGVRGMYDFRNGDGHGAPDLCMLQWDPAKNAWFIASGVGARK